MEDEIKKVVEVLNLGGIILYPTDTIWGIGCDATNSKAVNKVYDLKGRGQLKLQIVLIESIEVLLKYVEEVPDLAIDLINSFTDPITIVYEGARNLAKNVATDDNTAAIRIPRDEFCQKLLKAFGKPIISTSANFSGNPTPLSFSKIPTEIINGVDYVVGINQNLVNRPKLSTVVRITQNGEIQVLRN